MNAIDDLKREITLGRLRLAAGGLLADCGIRDPMLEADRIVCAVAGIDRAALHAHPEKKAGPANCARIIELSVRRACGEPLAYLVGSSIFCGRSLFVDRRVLIPRPETEILTEAAGEIVREIGPVGTFADWCTGSGAIAVALLADNPGWRAYAVDSSRDALAVASINARKYQVDDRLTLVECRDPSAASAVIDRASLDIVIANPPYVESSVIETLDAEVRDYEPRAALDGGADGLDVVRELMRALPKMMRPGAPLLLETGGERQVEAVARMAEREGALVFAGSMRDHRGIARFAKLVRAKVAR